MRISDWSSDVCSSDLDPPARSRIELRRAGRSRTGRRLRPFYCRVGVAPALPIRARVRTLYWRELRARFWRHGRFPACPGREGGRMEFPDRNPLLVLTGLLFPDRPVSLRQVGRSEEHKSELQYLIRISYAVICYTKTTKHN